MNQKKYNTVRQNVVEVFDQYLGEDYLLFAFGSFARGEISQTSDIDLAVYAQEKIPPAKIVTIKDDLEKKVGTLRDFDVVNLTENIVEQKLLRNIIDGGEIWHAVKNSEELLKNLRKRLTNTAR
jgi:predicted nucleotidyltransferase